MTAPESGRYLRRGHECSVPTRETSVVGDIWECACGRRWRFGTRLRDLLTGPWWYRTHLRPLGGAA